MAGTETEEARKADRPNARIDAFERPAEDFRAHVDAEGDLQARTMGSRRRRRTRLCERSVQAPLGGAFGRFLEYGVDAIVPVG